MQSSFGNAFVRSNKGGPGEEEEGVRCCKDVSDPGTGDKNWKLRLHTLCLVGVRPVSQKFRCCHWRRRCLVPLLKLKLEHFPVFLQRRELSRQGLKKSAHLHEVDHDERLTLLVGNRMLRKRWSI